MQLRLKRVRMARRHPAPQCVRQRLPRSRRDEPRPVLSDWLSSWGTFISAIAAAIGLIVSGIATWAAVRSLNEQQADSKQEDQLRAREQASQVSTWLEDGDPFSGVVVIDNYSVYPIEKWGLYLRVDADSNPSKSDFNVPPRAEGVTNVIPPCTRVLINLVKFRKDVAMDLNDVDASRDIYVEGINFEDAQGKAWHRQMANSLLGGKPGLRSGWVGDQDSSSVSLERQRLTGCSG